MKERFNDQLAVLLPELNGASSWITVPARHVRGDMYAVLLPGGECAAWTVFGRHYLSRGRTVDEFVKWGWLTE